MAEDNSSGGKTTLPRLEAEAHGAVLRITLTNNSGHPIKVDRELVFLIRVTPVDSDNRGVNVSDQRAVPLPDKKEAMSRFVWLQPGKSIERKLNMTEPFKEFLWGHSDKMDISAYERLVKLPPNETIARLDVSYGVEYLKREAIESYLGTWPKDLYDGPLRCSVQLAGINRTGRAN